MRRSIHTALALALVGSAGCAEDPSYYLRWKIASIDGDTKAREPDSARVCADSGLGQLRLSTYDAGTTTLADRRLIACAAPEFPDDPAPGPELEEGDYDVKLEALRDTGELWEREFCSPGAIPALWDPQVPAKKSDPDEEDGTLHCSYRDVTLSCYEAGSGCTHGSFGCDCRSEKEQAGKDGEPDTDDDELACDGGAKCNEVGICGQPDCEGGAGCACRDPGDDPVCEPGNQCVDGYCVPTDDGVCGDVQAYCELEPSRPRLVRRWYCQYAWDEASVTIDADHKPELDSFVLVAPPQCDDGVDNDADGLTDLGDPACLSSPLLGHEIDDRAVSSLSASVTYLGANPNVKCPGIGIGRVHLELDDGSGEPELIGDVPCNAPLTSFPSFSRALTEGDYVLRVVGIASGTEDTPVTKPVESEPFHVDPEVGTFLKTTFDIGAGDFLEPLEGPVGLFFKFQANDEYSRGCTPSGPGGDLVIERIAFSMYEGDGQSWTPIDDPLGVFGFDLSEFNPDPPVGGAIEMDCPEHGFFSQSVSWGNYAIRATGLASDAACFDLPEMEPYRLAPGDDYNTVTLPRVLEGDPKMPPAVCLDCVDDGDCSPTSVCVDGVCMSS